MEESVFFRKMGICLDDEFKIGRVLIRNNGEEECSALKIWKEMQMAA